MVGKKINSGATIGYEAELWAMAERGRDYDSCCSSGMFVQSVEFIHVAGGAARGDLSNYTMRRPARINLTIRGGSFYNDRHTDLKADFIFANPSFNVLDWGGEWPAEVRKRGHMLISGRNVGTEPQKDDGEPFEDKMKWLGAELHEQQAGGTLLEAAITETLRPPGVGGRWQ